ncbi:MAG: AarF/ABC1/UbiB kinase family protein [Gammaproteobacteria bacterium]|nr:AarF/ABC1/UbiB kinase family protein [Gammaproteobacteria bacterium]MBU2056418.1 AarF/ABC1/UbiB kinase family protein [Gammaproteobacteria bacterium]MBU2175510.1 AarF/ABC1/UbiB kinase family protein [Gammaproteobacteria bacterium]MBU2246665.1 AarF/ABC1/UbiB kinase family protein [Gammaproteobacteria bacterium]MBU2345871.1 AarF/ABC1/UbiB kinase family protein [Gammaproteobacteria bacterium]
MKDASAKLPRQPLARLGGLAALAGRVAGSVLFNGAKQLVQGQSPKAKDLLLTPANLQRVSDKLAQLRGAAMKVGQLLSMDAGDLLPAELTELLARLRSNANPMLPKELALVLRTELGDQWQQHFSQFTFSPLAAASIGQVHLAHHDNGTKLAVKVQYPSIGQSIDSDVDNVAMLLKLSGLLPDAVDYQSVLNEAKLQLHQEADYLQEAAYLQRYRTLLAEDSQFVLPELYPQLCTSKLMTMSFVEGVPIESLQQYSQQVRDQAMTQLFALLFREIFEFRLVQTDPNFANYLYQPESAQLVLLDFGACRDYPESISQGYRLLLSAAIANDVAGIEGAMRQIGFFSQDILPAQKQAILALVQLISEPVQSDTAYAFGQTDLAQRVRKAGTALSLQQNYWHTPPIAAVFLHRKMAGLYLLAARLKANVNIRQLLIPYLN